MGGDGLLSTAFIATVISVFVSSLVVIYSKYIEKSTSIRIQEMKSMADESLARLKIESDLLADNLKRKRELAEEILAAFYRVRDSVILIRSTFSSSAEAESRVRPPGETEGLKCLRDAYFAILTRYENRRVEFADLRAKKYRAIALFGAGVEKPFTEIDSVLRSITTSASLLIELSSEFQGGALSAESRRNMEADIWRHSTREDLIEMQVDSAIHLIEEIMRPVLQKTSL